MEMKTALALSTPAKHQETVLSLTGRIMCRGTDISLEQRSTDSHMLTHPQMSLMTLSLTGQVKLSTVMLQLKSRGLSQHPATVAQMLAVTMT